MRNYEEEYYIVRLNNDESVLNLKPASNMGFRDHVDDKLDFGDGPIFLENDFKGEVPFLLGSAHLEGNLPVVCRSIYESLRIFSIDGFQLFPAVIVGDDGELHEDFFFFNIYKDLDCIDFKASDVEDYEPMNEFHVVDSYVLNNKLLSNIDEEKRLIIRPSCTSEGEIFIHQRIVDILDKNRVDGFSWYKLSEYESGNEFFL
ncbi:hypothetical protein L4C34_18750 [Vibrio profundum]|uniref:imm11 family protein n=1 Tax=Vibrio profundum TaxID=2910247 RepID=UPI003D13AFA5